jgi:hypothetical protein
MQRPNKRRKQTRAERQARRRKNERAQRTLSIDELVEEMEKRAREEEERERLLSGEGAESSSG